MYMGKLMIDIILSCIHTMMLHRIIGVLYTEAILGFIYVVEYRYKTYKRWYNDLYE